MKNKIKFISMSVALSFLIACQGQETSTLSLSDGSGIVGGEKVKSGDEVEKHLVMVWGKSPTGGKVCSGTIITSNLILTAAHCVHEREKLEVGFGKSGLFPNWEPVDRAIVHEQYNGNVGYGYDLAVVRLKKPLPKGYGPVAVVGEEDMLTINEPVILAGYGRTSVDKPSSSGNLRKVETTLARWIRGFLIVDMSNGKGMCDGDSGGPMFVRRNNQLVLAGVTSFTRNSPHSKIDCMNDGYYADLITHGSWLRTTARAINN
ncbi:trypsin-like serine protease [Bdellovibrio sp. KM01]|uniref:S1 family peptidase n=1 Tax=Bdellovibrio sp. KM01 TaxID=2748865 RepID=UPI0015EAA186|nr:trypsin-like serine protease [Bdellovibrio sp. KM01]QLY25569.1 trypsin-like serine protease [Bdellovibrio sp. KM01]